MTKVDLWTDSDEAARTHCLQCCHPKCLAKPWPEAPIPLCQSHYVVVIRHWLSYAGDQQDAAMRAAVVGLAVESATPKPARTACVYFIRFGERVKIGFSANIRQRLGNLPYESVLRVISGTPTDERLWHARWKHLCVTGEWFQLTEELLAAIEQAGPDLHPRKTWHHESPCGTSCTEHS